MSRNKTWMLMLWFFLCSIHMIAQTDYYYHNGNKIPLILNENKVCVSIPKDCDIISEKIRANVQVIETIKDEFFDIFVISRSDYEELESSDSLKDAAKSVIITNSYITTGGVEVFSTPYLGIKLKREEDIDILTSYAEQYRLRIVKNMPSMPLWYILSVTLECENSPLECANELFESGYFAASVPDLVSNSMLTAILNISSIKTDLSFGFYNLQGQRMNGLQKGINIINGNKIMVK